MTSHHVMHHMTTVMYIFIVQEINKNEIKIKMEIKSRKIK